MYANDTNNTNKIILPELSYLITGVCFSAHNNLGRYSREKQYSDEIEKRFKEVKLPYKRELFIKGTSNIIDFLVDDKIILEVKAKRLVTKEDYFQIQRYLQVLGVKLGLIVNFRDKYIKPVRIIKIDTDRKNKFV